MWKINIIIAALATLKYLDHVRVSFITSYTNSKGFLIFKTCYNIIFDLLCFSVSPPSQGIDVALPITGPFFHFVLPGEGHLPSP